MGDGAQTQASRPESDAQGWCGRRELTPHYVSAHYTLNIYNKC